MAEFLEIYPELFNKWTSLEKALEVYNRDRFLEFKRNLLEEEFDEDKQFKVWEDYHKLMFKAANNSFRTGDWELLQSYRFSMTDIDPTLRLLNFMGEAVHIPAPSETNKEGEVRLSRKYLDQEVTAKLFEHVFKVLVGLEDLRVCAARDCEELFIPTPQGREQKYHTKNCYWREYRRKERARKQNNL